MKKYFELLGWNLKILYLCSKQSNRITMEDKKRIVKFQKELWQDLRIQTHITGLDRLLYGGLCLRKEPYFILIKGAADTEKTAFGLQMLYGIAQSLKDEKIKFEKPEAYFYSTYNSKSYLNNMSVNAFISTCMRQFQRRNLHQDRHVLSSAFTNLLFKTDDLIGASHISSEIDPLPLSEIKNNPDGLIVEGAMYYNVRTEALHIRNSQKRDDKRNMVYTRKHNTINDYCEDKGPDTKNPIDIPKNLEDMIGIKMAKLHIKDKQVPSSINIYPSAKLVGIELKAYSNHMMRRIKEKMDVYRKDKIVFILIVDEHTSVFDDNADMIIDLSSEYADDYLSYYFKITKSRLQDTYLGYHQYKRREYGIDVFPSVFSYIQQRWYFKRGLLYTHSNVISERFFEYLDRKRFQKAKDISFSDYIEHRDEYKKWCYNEIYQPDTMNVLSYDLLSRIMIGEPASGNNQSENIYGNVGSVTGIIGEGNTYKRFLTFGSAFSTTLDKEHVLMLLFNKEENTIRRRLSCPARLLRKKHKDNDGCMGCYEHIHFMNIPMGAITPEEFLYYFDRQLWNKYENGKKIKRVIVDDLQIIDYCYPKLSKDPLFLSAIMYVCREHGVALYLLCDTHCNLRNPLRAMADNVIITEKTGQGKPRVYIERYAGYSITPGKMFCGEVNNVEELFVCRDRYNEKGDRILNSGNFSIDSTVISDVKEADIKNYWKK